MPEATWENERCYAMRLLGKSYQETKNDYLSLKWFRLACAEAPSTREPWVDLSMFCYRHYMWQESLYAAKQALAITDRQLVYTCDPEVWTERPYDLASIAAWKLGYREMAIEYCKKAIEFNPNDVRLIQNLDSMQKEIA